MAPQGAADWNHVLHWLAAVEEMMQAMQPAL